MMMAAMVAAEYDYHDNINRLLPLSLIGASILKLNLSTVEDCQEYYDKRKRRTRKHTY
jgi:hypothetical protein